MFVKPSGEISRAASDSFQQGQQVVFQVMLSLVVAKQGFRYGAVLLPDNFMIMEIFLSTTYTVTSSWSGQLNAPERFILILSLSFILWATHGFIHFRYVVPFSTYWS